MIKALLGNGTVLIGLSARNIERLQAGQPILFDLTALGLAPQQVAIAAGATEEDIATELQREGGKMRQSLVTDVDGDQPPSGRPGEADYAAAQWAITKMWNGEIGEGMAERLAHVALDTAWAARLTAAAGGKSVTCPRCWATSHNPNDVREGYCGACHEWTLRPGAAVNG